jgi:CheY-like chemotaxis protein
MWGIDMLFQGGVSMIIFVLVIQNNDLEKLTFSEVAVYGTRYVFIHARDYSQALQVIQIFKPDYFLIEKNLPMTSGQELATALCTQPKMEQVPTIIFDACRTLVAQEKKTSSSDKAMPTIPHIEILLTIIDKMVLLPGQRSLNSFSMN